MCSHMYIAYFLFVCLFVFLFYFLPVGAYGGQSETKSRPAKSEPASPVPPPRWTCCTEVTQLGKWI